MGVFNPLFGSMRGKYGGSVLYRYNGKQCVRERAITVSNPRSAKQAIQRAILSTVGQFVSAFAPILNNSVQSIQKRAATLAFIRKENMNMLRRLAVTQDGFYNERGGQFIAPNDYLISRGTLIGLNPLSDSAARNRLGDGQLSFTEAAILTADLGITASQAFPTIELGDQITVLASAMEDSAEGSRYGYCRFAFKDDITPAWVEGDVSGTYVLNPAAIDLSKAAGNWRGLVFSSADNMTLLYIGALTGGNYDDFIDLGGVIVSRENGKMRSTSHMVSSTTATEYTLDLVYPTYMASGESFDFPSDIYLDNDSNAQPAPFVYITNVDGTAVVFPKSLNVSSTASVLCKIRGNELPSSFSMSVQFSIQGSGGVLTANFTNEASGSSGGITFSVNPSNEIEVTASTPSTLIALQIRYRDAIGHDVVWQ